MKTFILTEAQLVEYVERKKSEKIYYDILEEFHRTNKFLNKNLSKTKQYESILENYKRKNLLTPRVNELLIKNKILNENYEII